MPLAILVLCLATVMDERHVPPCSSQLNGPPSSFQGPDFLEFFPRSFSIPVGGKLALMKLRPLDCQTLTGRGTGSVQEVRVDDVLAIDFD